MLDKILKERNLPEFTSREEMLNVLLNEEYGYIPPEPDSVTYKEEICIRIFCAGRAVLKKVEATVTIAGKEFTFPFFVAIPKKEGKHPFFILANFRNDVPDIYMPAEEIIDNGFAILSFCYKDITSDDGDFTNGLAGILYENGERKSNDAGKIAMWAWAAQRVMDYAQTLDCLDFDCSIVCGHSRLGKTALLAAATDERFKFAYSNDSGCSGAAISRGNAGETIYDICKVFPYWFCENYHKYVNAEDTMPFDQHYLLASIAPRYIYVASANEDDWADPLSEMLNCVAVSDVYSKYDKKGFIHSNRLPQVGDEFHDGCVGYHLREGLHYLSREDWLKAMKFVRRHSK